MRDLRRDAVFFLIRPLLAALSICLTVSLYNGSASFKLPWSCNNKARLLMDLNVDGWFGPCSSSY